jgi:hypothetical protein
LLAAADGAMMTRELTRFRAIPPRKETTMRHRMFVGLSLCTISFASVLLAEQPDPPKTYGTASVSYHRVAFSEFSPEASASGYSDLFFGGHFARYPASSAGFLVAVPHLPSGALVDSVELDYCDTSAADDLSLTVYGSNYLGGAIALLGTATSSGSAGCDFSVADVSAAGFVVNNNTNQIVLQALIGPTDGSVAISGAIVRYFLQVSPDPPGATFLDVPAGHPQHQFIEALVAAGITAGCGSGNFCPNAPLTRGQMAVFLSKALGLQFN